MTDLATPQGITTQQNPLGNRAGGGGASVADESDIIYLHFVEDGRRQVKAGDNAKWELGDLVNAFCAEFKVEMKRGHPTGEAPERTLADLARDIGEDRRVVSAVGLTSAFYPADVRTDGQFADLSWRHFNRAREASSGSLENALELLHKAVSLHLGVEDFRQYLANAYFEGEVAYRELPERLRGFVPAGEAVWVKVRRLKGDG